MDFNGLNRCFFYRTYRAYLIVRQNLFACWLVDLLTRWLVDL